MHPQVDPNRNFKQTSASLVAESSDVFEKTKLVHVLLSTRRGYIFIQTDKTIYNPGEHGKKSELSMNYTNRCVQSIHCIQPYSCLILYIFLVKYRIFTLDNYLLPINDPINIQIFVSIRIS